MSFSVDATADLREALGDQADAFAVTLTWGAQSIVGNVSPPRETLTVEDGAEYTVRVVDFMAVRADFTGGVLPAKRATVGLSGVNHFVHEVQVDEADGLAVVLSLRREA